MSLLLRLFTVLLLVGASWMAPLVASYDPSSQSDPVSVSLIAEEDSVSPGQSVWVAIQVNIEPHWHAYWKNPGDAGMPLTIEWSLPKGFTTGETLWPTPTRFGQDSAVGFGYENDVVLLTQVTAPKDFSGSASLATDVRWVVCNEETCLPGDSQAKVTLESNKNSVSDKNSSKATFFENARDHIPKTTDQIAISRKNNFIELSVPKELIGSTVHKAEFFPEKSTSVNSNAVPEWVIHKDKNNGKLFLPDNGEKDVCKGVVVFHPETGPPLAFEINASLASMESESPISMSSPHEALKTNITNADSPDDFDFHGGVLLAIGLAFIGGMILNLMPCVLPVISFKILGFIKLAGQSRRLIFEHGLSFCGGVLLSFWTLAAFLLILQGYGKAVGWGFQLQEPIFVMVLASFVFIFALSLFGVFEMGTSFIGMFSQNQSKNEHRNELVSSFFSGIMATAVATPCTGPFLGSAVGFAVTLPPLQSMAIFTSIGLGMSFPYLALAAFPSLLRYMPKPGPWMATFKQLMGFMMVATTVWLVWVFGAQMGSFAITLLLVAFFLFSVAGWVYGRWGTVVQRPSVRITSQLVAAVIFSLGLYVAYTSASPWAEAMSNAQVAMSTESGQIAGDWETFSPERVAELQAKGIPVFIDFTAKWCLICQANHLVLSSEEVAKSFAARGVVRMKADWTKRDDMIAAELKKFGRNSVPLYVLYEGDKEIPPKILPQVLTPDNVSSALDKIDL